MMRNTRLPLLCTIHSGWHGGSLENPCLRDGVSRKTKLEVSHVDGIDMLTGTPNSFYGVTLVWEEVWKYPSSTSEFFVDSESTPPAGKYILKAHSLIH